MAQPEMSQKAYQTYGALESNLPFVAHPTTQPLSDDTHAMKSGWFKRALVVFAIFVPSCVGLHLLLHEHPTSVQKLQAHLAWKLGSFGLNHDASEHSILEQGTAATNYTHISTPFNNTLVRRQGGPEARSTFYIPIASRQYRFMSRGSIAQSTFKVAPFKPEKDPKLARYMVVKVKITRNPRNAARAYTIGKGNGATGVVFSAPTVNGRGRGNWPSFEVTVGLPVTSEQRHPLGNLDVRLPQFHHEFGDLAKSFMFSRIFVASTNAHMTFGPVVASNLQVSTTNGQVKFSTVMARSMVVSTTVGRMTFDSIYGETVQLQNRNGQIAAGKTTTARSLMLTNTNSKITGEFTLKPGSMAKLATRNAPITGQFILKPSKNAVTAAKYNIQASTTNQPLDLKVTEQPLGSSCNLWASSSAGVRVHMPPAFEGSFRIRSVQNQPIVEAAGKTDPAGRNRERFIQYTNPRSKTNGRTGWGRPDDKERHGTGMITLSSTKGQAQLVFD